MSLEFNKIYHEDCFDGFKRIPDKSIDLVLCDMPYGTTACKWDSILDLELIWKELSRISKDNAASVLFAQMPFSAKLVNSNINKFRYNWIWDKSQGTGHLNAKKSPLKNHEDILVFYEKQTTYNPQFSSGEPYKTISAYIGSENYGSQVRVSTNNNGIRYPKTIIRFRKERPRLHPTQKPVALIEYLIKTYSNEGDTVLDFCMGSGTTAIAAINTKRNFIGFEKEKKYYEIALNRIKEHK
jgi:site-specific DNA-methyltransferase (adenine-specific)